jgi:two-component system cell cycle response regulator
MSQHNDDRRELLRKRMLKSGRIVFNNRHSVIDCVVRDLTGKGARLMVASIVGIPDNFELHIGDDRKVARVVWKSADSLGVAFGEG